MRNSRRSGGLRDKLAARPRLRIVIACGVLAVLSIPVAVPRLRLAGNPKPPTQAQINAAENRVRQQQAALGAQQRRLSGASAQLAARRRSRRPTGLASDSF